MAGFEPHAEEEEEEEEAEQPDVAGTARVVKWVQRKTRYLVVVVVVAAAVVVVEVVAVVWYGLWLRSWKMEVPHQSCWTDSARVVGEWWDCSTIAQEEPLQSENRLGTLASCCCRWPLCLLLVGTALREGEVDDPYCSPRPLVRPA